MTAAKAAKEMGFKSLSQVSLVSGESSQNLNNWFNKKPLRFEVILLGSMCKLKQQDGGVNG